jgi:nitrate/TMAO reductase-like tetraheme cytochrome c subunit
MKEEFFKMKNKIFIITILLILLTSGTILAQEPKQISVNDYQDPTTCMGCHKNIYDQWQGSMHSLSEVDPIYKRVYNMAAQETEGFTNAYCSSCHAPISTSAAKINEKQKDPTTELGKKGISCDFCHTVSEIKETHNAQYISSPGNTKRGPFDDSKSPAHKTQYSEVHTKSEFCGSCHNVTHPVNNTPLERTYTEWKEGPYNTGNPETTTYCQDCHMTPGPQVTKPNPGKASIIGPEREHIYKECRGWT